MTGTGPAMTPESKGARHRPTCVAQGWSGLRWFKQRGSGTPGHQLCRVEMPVARRPTRFLVQLPASCSWRSCVEPL